MFQVYAVNFGADSKNMALLYFPVNLTSSIIPQIQISNNWKKEVSWQPLSKFLHVTQLDKELPGPNSGYLVDLTPERVVSDWVGDKGCWILKAMPLLLLLPFPFQISFDRL